MATADTTTDDGGRTPFVSIVARIAEHARQTPDKDAIVFVRHAPEGLEAEHVSYAQLDREARRYAAWLASRCAPGDRVLLVFPPGLHFFKALIACEYAGLAAVPVPSPSRSTKREPRVAHIARDAGVHLVLTTARHKPLTEEILEDTAGSVECVATDDADFEAALDAAPAWTAPEIGPETTAILQYTSGSTSDPKGVVVPHRALAYNCVLIEQALSGRLKLSSEIRKMSQSLLGARLRAMHVPPRVVLDNHASNTHTVLEVNGRDRPGLLHDVTAAISEQGLQIASAHVRQAALDVECRACE